MSNYTLFNPTMPSTHLTSMITWNGGGGDGGGDRGEAEDVKPTPQATAQAKAAATQATAQAKAAADAKAVEDARVAAEYGYHWCCSKHATRFR